MLDTTQFFMQMTRRVERGVRAERRLEDLERQLEQAHRTMTALAMAIEARDPNRLGHTQRVTSYLNVILPDLGLTPKEEQVLRIAASLHDVGKIALPENVLTKTGRDTPLERRKAMSHTKIGEEILRPLVIELEDGSRQSVATIVRHLHERFDGTGTPDGLFGDEIPRLSRILACLDYYDACLCPPDPVLRAERRKGGLPALEAARIEFELEAGRSLDPDLTALVARHHDTLVRSVWLPMTWGGDHELAFGSVPDFARVIAKSQREVERLFESAHRLVGSSLEVSEVLGILTRNVEQVVPWTTIIAFEHDPLSGRVEVKRVDGHARSLPLNKRVLRVDKGAFEICLARRTPLVEHCFIQELRHLSPELAEHSPMGTLIPLIEDEVVGFLGVFHQSGHRISSDELRLLESLCRLAAPALKNALSHQSSHKEAITDELTGLTNDRHLLREGTRMLRTRGERPVALFMIDLDGFKQVNDRHGHEVGDAMLVEVARSLRAGVRPQDILARKGGDEFVMILADTNRETAEVRARQMEGAIRSAFVKLSNGQRAQVGASIGTACAPDDGSTLEVLLRMADQRMYKRKRQRHNHRNADLPFSYDDPLAA